METQVPHMKTAAQTGFLKGPYRFEILEGARNFALQMQPDRTTQLLLEHLAEHAK